MCCIFHVVFSYGWVMLWAIHSNLVGDVVGRVAPLDDDARVLVQRVGPARAALAVVLDVLEHERARHLAQLAHLRERGLPQLDHHADDHARACHTIAGRTGALRRNEDPRP